MREVNFSIPNANKASVGITTALYDRRALDCTSTLPLINSLNHLAYLTTSSARIRDILTVDGGVERLVCILKEGKSKDVMEVWKWNLAFQCVVNIGVRGSENVRTRVVEADMVPVIATILDNYVRVVDRFREKSEAEAKRSARLGSSRHYPRSTDMASSSGQRSERTRRQAPPPIEIPPSFNQHSRDSGRADAPLPPYALSSPPERTTFARPHIHHHNRSQEGRLLPTLRTAQVNQPLGTAVPIMDTQDSFGIRPVRDIDRLPSMLPTLHGDITSQPESPTTPSGPIRPDSPSASIRSRRRPSIRHQLSLSGPMEDVQSEEIMADEPSGVETSEPIVGIQNDINMQDIVDGDEMLGGGPTPVALTTTGDEGNETETFNITHRSTINGSIVNPMPPTTVGMGFPPMQQTINPAPPALQVNWNTRFALPERIGGPNSPALPRDDDVLMSLQLLAYVSKYCNLRSYFQKSHLVPRLKLPDDLTLIDGEMSANSPSPSTLDEDEDEEYLLPDDFNIFPLVEKFTVRHYSQDMQYWAGVVMRNLCRKDDSRGGVRQCAYYQCGKWEEYPRQFAKCRRCRRTKYCSKECQKSAWVYHRHWCVAAQP